MTGHATRFVHASDVTDDLVTAWRDLATRAAEPNPFAEPECVLPSFRHLSDHARSGLLTVRDGDRLDAVLPVSWPVRRELSGGRRLPLPAWEVPTTPYRPLSTPLVDASRAADAMGALTCVPADARRPAVALLLRNFRDDGPVAAALDEALGARGQHVWRTKTYERAVLNRELAPHLMRGRRYKRVRTARIKLDQQVGPSTLVDRAGAPEAVEEFLRLEASGWKGRTGTALLCHPEHAAWFREVCAALAPQGRVEMLTLEVDGRTIAIECSFKAGDAAFHLKTAYDESYAPYLPGMHALVHFVDEIDAGDVGVRDSCTVPDNELLNQLWPDRQTFSTVVVPLHGRVGSGSLRVLQGVRSATTVVRSAAARGRSAHAAARIQLGAGRRDR